MNTAFRGIFIYGELEKFLVSCLKDSGRRKQIRGRVTKMLIEIKSMDALKEINPDDLTDSQVAALHWLYLMYWHHENNYRNCTGLRTLLNDDFYSDPCSVM